MHLRRHLNYANVAATAALIIAVAGIPTAIAVSKGAKRSDINSKGKIRTGHVTTAKLADGSVTAAKIAGIDVVQAQRRTAAPPPTVRRVSGCSPAAAISRAAVEPRCRPRDPTGNGWHAAQQRRHGQLSSVTVYALCLRD